MPVQAGDIVWKITADDAGFDSAVSNAEKSAVSLGGKFEDTAAKAEAMGKKMTVAGAAITGALVLATKKYVENASAIGDMSMRTGVAVERLSEFQFGLERSGSSLDAFEQGLRFMQQRLDGAGQAGIEANDKIAKALEKSRKEVGRLQSQLANTSSQEEYAHVAQQLADKQAEVNEIMSGGVEQSDTYAKALSRIGLSIQALEGLPPDKAFIKIADALSKVTDASERAALASDLFGSRVGTQLLPFLANGEKGIEAFAKKAHELNAVLDGEAVASAKAFEEAVQNMRSAIVTGFVNEAGPAMIEILTPLIEQLTKLGEVAGKFAKEHPELTATIIKGAFAFGAFNATIGPMIIGLAHMAPQLIVMRKLLGAGGVATAATEAAKASTVAGRGFLGLGAAARAGGLGVLFLKGTLATLVTGAFIASMDYLLSAMSKMRAQNAQTKDGIAQANAIMQQQIGMIRELGLAFDENTFAQMTNGEQVAYVRSILDEYGASLQATTGAIEAKNAALAAQSPINQTLTAENGKLIAQLDEETWAQQRLAGSTGNVNEQLAQFSMGAGSASSAITITAQGTYSLDAAQAALAATVQNLTGQLAANGVAISDAQLAGLSLDEQVALLSETMLAHGIQQQETTALQTEQTAATDSTAASIDTLMQRMMDAETAGTTYGAQLLGVTDNTIALGDAGYNTLAPSLGAVSGGLWNAKQNADALNYSLAQLAQQYANVQASAAGGYASGGVVGYAVGGVVGKFATGGVVPNFTMPAIPKMANGGQLAPVIINERGPEPLFLPVGTRVLSHADAMGAMRSGARDGARERGEGVVMHFAGMNIGTVGTDESPERVWKKVEPWAYRDFAHKFDMAKRR